VLPSQIPKVYLIAHSAGGWCTTSIMKAFGEQVNKGLPFFEQVEKMAMTDSCNFYKDDFGKHKDFFKAHCVHYVASQKKLGQPLGRTSGLAPEVSAGH
jgi:hypothetical protein